MSPNTKHTSQKNHPQIFPMVAKKVGRGVHMYIYTQRQREIERQRERERERERESKLNHTYYSSDQV